MVIRQAFNNRIKAWVKIKIIKGKGSKILNVKQQNPTVPFANVKKVEKKAEALGIFF